MIGPLIKLINPNVVDMCAYVGAGFHNLLVVSLNERHPKEVLKTAMSLLGTGQLSLTKVMVLVGPGRDPRDFRAVLRDMWHRFDPEIVEALSNVHFDIAEAQWDAMTERLSARIHEDYAARRQSTWSRWFGLSPFQTRTYLPAFARALALLLVTVGIYRLASPMIQPGPQTPANPPVAAILDPTANPDLTLDPVTVEFIEQSELLLRSVMKLKPNSTDDVEQAKTTAARQLIALDQRKQAAVENRPVVNAMDKYENILRDIRNISDRAAADDIADIQNRIEKTGLIADMKAFQPRINVVETDLGNEK